MAYWHRRRGRQVTVYYYDTNLKKNVQVPRTVTAEWDDLPDEAVALKVMEWEETSGTSRQRSLRRAVLTQDGVSGLIQSHLQDHANLRSPQPGTMVEYQYHFERFILPYFVGSQAEKDVRRWHLLTPKFASSLIEDGEVGSGTVRKVCDTLARFGRYLAMHQVIPSPWLIPKPRAPRKRTSPLIKRITSQDALSAMSSMRSMGHIEGLLVVLFGYFGSLRPEELYALSKTDILTSDAARMRSKTRTRMNKYGLGSSLAVVVDKTILARDIIPFTKTHYATGVVTIWDVKAVELAAPILARVPDGRLLLGTRWHQAHIYKEQVFPQLGVSCQDLRRASANYLGKVVGLDPILLQNHLRHSEIETTMLYVRDPHDDEKETGQQDFSDVR